MPELAALRAFLADTDAPLVEIETEDLLALCELAERALADDAAKRTATLEGVGG